MALFWCFVLMSAPTAHTQKLEDHCPMPKEFICLWIAAMCKRPVTPREQTSLLGLSQPSCEFWADVFLCTAVQSWKLLLNMDQCPFKTGVHVSRLLPAPESSNRKHKRILFPYSIRPVDLPSHLLGCENTGCTGFMKALVRSEKQPFLLLTCPGSDTAENLATRDEGWCQGRCSNRPAALGHLLGENWVKLFKQTFISCEAAVEPAFR